VIFGDITDAEGQAVEVEICAAFGEAHYRGLDVTSEDDWRTAVDFAVATYGPLYILINNAVILILHIPTEERTT
jgi:3alpha(or 20beta)-hydroxysteroid dehydrogenase